MQWRQSFASRLQGRGIAARATPSYSQGKRKSGYRRDLAELGQRGTRRVARPAPTYDAAKGAEAIERRRQAWARIGAHYGEAGDAQIAEGIAAYVAEQFPGRKAREGRPGRAGAGAEVRAAADRTARRAPAWQPRPRLSQKLERHWPNAYARSTPWSSAWRATDKKAE